MFVLYSEKDPTELQGKIDRQNDKSVYVAQVYDTNSQAVIETITAALEYDFYLLLAQACEAGRSFDRVTLDGTIQPLEIVHLKLLSMGMSDIYLPPKESHRLKLL
jgi:hypothetical protein